MLLVVHADTYNATLRDHHYRIKQLSSSITFLQELPLFKQLTPSTLNSIAYTLKSQIYVKYDIIINKGDIINNLFIILSGTVKAYASVLNNNENNIDNNDNDNKIDENNETGVINNHIKKDNKIKNNKNIKVEKKIENKKTVSNNDKNKNDKNKNNVTTSTTTTSSNSTTTNNNDLKDNKIELQHNKKRIPKIAISMLGRGKIIGESEIFKELSNFEFSYEIATIGTELLLMPATVFREAMSADHFKNSDAYKIIESNSTQKILLNNNKFNRSNEAIKTLIIGDKSEIKGRTQLESE